MPGLATRHSPLGTRHPAPFTAAYGAVIRSLAEAALVETPRGRAGAALLHCPLFHDAEWFHFPNAQHLDEDGLPGRAFSASYAPREPAAAEEVAAALRGVFGLYAAPRAAVKQRTVLLRYQTSVTIGQRGEASLPLAESRSS